MTITVTDVRQDFELVHGDIVKITEGTNYIWVLLDTGYEIEISREDLEKILEELGSKTEKGVEGK